MTMQLKSVRIDSFAAIDRLEIEGLEPGLNIIVGDNEAGKSTVMTALRAAFFHRHRAQTDAVRDFLPYHGQGRPEVAVTFTLGGIDYALAKSFLTRPHAELSWPGGRLEGDSVEDRLAELLGFTHPQRGAPKLAEHQGAFGLLWVQQGRAPEGVDVGAARDMLAASLEGEMGHFLGGGQGRAMLAAARALQDRFYTATLRARADSPLRQVEDTLASLRAALAEGLSRSRRYEDKLERLGDRRHRLAAYEDADAVGQADAALARAQEAARRLDGLQEAHRQAERNVEQARRQRQHAVQQLQARAALQAEWEAAQKALAAAEAEQARCRAGLDTAATQLATATQVFTSARQAEDGADAAERAARQDQHRRRLAEELAELRQRRVAAGQAAVQAHDVATGDGPVVDTAALAQLDATYQHLREAEIRLAAAAAQIRYEPEGDVPLLDDAGQVVPPGQDRPVSGTAGFTLAGVGRLVVTAGGETQELARLVEDARHDWLRLAGRFGVGSVAQARQKASDAQVAAAARKQAAEDLARLAPEGIAALDARIEGLSRSTELQPGEAASGKPAANALPAGQAAKEPPALSREEAGRLRRQAEDALAAARGYHTALSAEAVRAEARLEHAAAQGQDAARRLEAALAGAPDTALQEAVAVADRELLACEAVLAVRQREAAEADGEATRLELDRAARTREHLVRTLRDLSQEVHGLEGELRVEGASALDEETARQAEEIDRLEMQAARLAQEAEAAKLLHATLEECRRDAREQWLGPLKEKVTPYLRLVQPGGIVDFDDTTMDVRGVVRNGVPEEFRRLSHGAREQVAVITRLAIAEILQAAGHPAFIILDDALVNTDEKRLARMHLALGRAAAAMQVIVLTCRERDFIGLGAPLHRI